VNYRFCHRCQADLPPHDEGTLIFCSQCGAPQLLLSEDLLTQVENQANAAAEGAAVTSAIPHPQSQIWAGAIQCVGLAGIVAIGFACLSLLLPPVMLMTFLWATISPVVVIGLFQARVPQAPMSTSFGARLGLLTGLAVASALSIVFTIAALAERFQTHNLDSFDKQWALALDQMKDRMAGQPGADVSAVMQMFALPDFRAGVVLACIGFAIAALLVMTTIGGAFAGFVRSRPKV
jgi:hypothetical protein